MTFPFSFENFFVLGLGHPNIINVVGEIKYYNKKELNKLYKNSNTILLFVDIIFLFSLLYQCKIRGERDLILLLKSVEQSPQKN